MFACTWLIVIVTSPSPVFESEPAPSNPHGFRIVTQPVPDPSRHAAVTEYV